MEIEKAVYLAMAASTALTALCPAVRIYPDGEIQNVQLPTIKHFCIDDQSLHTHEGRMPLRTASFYQVSVYAASMREARLIAEQVIVAVDGVHAVESSFIHGFHTGSTRLPYDEDARAAGIAINFQIFYWTN